MARLIFASFIVIGFSLSSLEAAHAVTSEVSARKVKVAPKIDGDLNDHAWSHANWYTDFNQVGIPGKQADPQTRFKVVFDHQRIYFGIECFEPFTDKLRAEQTVNDTAVWADDCIEVFLGFSSERRKYVHVVVNSKGTIADAIYEKDGHRNTVWNIDGRAGTRVGDKSWTVEFSIPFYGLGIDSADSGFMNVARERQIDGRELSSFTPLVGGFHNPLMFAHFKLPEVDLAKYFWSLTPLFNQNTVSNTFRAETTISNNTGQFYAVEIVAALKKSGKNIKEDVGRDMLDAGQTHEHAFSVPLAGNGAQVLALSIRNAKSKEVYYKWVRSVELNNAPIEVFMKRPYWRNTIYSQQNIKEIELDVKLLIPEDQLEKLTAYFSLKTDNQKEERVLFNGTEQDLKPEFDITFPALDLKTGRYKIKIALKDFSGNIVHETIEPLRVLPPSPSGVEWWIEDGVLIRNNEKFLPYGYYTLYPKRINEIKNDGFCTAVLWYGVPDLENYLEVADTARMSVVAYPYHYQETKETRDRTKLFTEEETRALESRVKTLSDHASMMAWYLVDEPSFSQLPKLNQIRNVLSEADPYRPTVLLANAIEPTYKFSNVADILMNDPYPGFKSGGYGALPIETVSHFVKAAQDATAGKRPVWTTLQGFDWNFFNRRGQRAPNFIEARNMNYQAVVYGATGYLWYADVYSRMSPPLDMAIPFIGKEMNLLKDYVLSKDVAGRVRVDVADSKHIHTSWRENGEDWVLFVVNTAAKKQNVKIDIDFPLKSEIFVVSENRKIKTEENCFYDVFDVYDTHIYTNVRELATILSLEEMKQKALFADRARKKPGNLVFEDGDVKIKHSEELNDAYIQPLFDGITHGAGILGGLYLAAVKNTPAWLDMEWPEVQAISQVVLYNEGAKLTFEIQIPEKADSWRTISSVTDATNDVIEVNLSQIETKKIRLYFTQFVEQVPMKDIRISEIEVYGSR